MLFEYLGRIQAGCVLPMPWVQKYGGGSIRVSTAPSALAAAAWTGHSHHEGQRQRAGLGARARQLCQAGRVQSQHGCACTPELLLLRSTQVHSVEMLECPCAVPARSDKATCESVWRNPAKAPLLQNQVGASHWDPLHTVSAGAYPEP